VCVKFVDIDLALSQQRLEGVEGEKTELQTYCDDQKICYSKKTQNGNEHI
jgi:hypothetical protein